LLGEVDLAAVLVLITTLRWFLKDAADLVAAGGAER
jgi:hypothetical protein